MIELYDNTKVSGHKACERRYFYRHVLHLVPEGPPSAALAFGTSWHKAMDVVWAKLAAREGSDTDILAAAFAAWHKSWVAEGMPPHDQIDDEVAQQYRLGPRTPDTAIEMIHGYLLERRHFIQSQYRLVAIERPFAVPLEPDDPSLFYCGRLDKVIESAQGHIYVVDHKTTSMYKKDGFFRTSWLDSFSPDSQLDGYAYAAHLLYGDRFKGMFIDGALVHKHVHNGFCWVPVLRAVEALDEWWWETRAEIKRMKMNLWAAREDSTQNLPYMPAYRKETGACYDFETACPYLDLCKSWTNPARQYRQHGVPLGYQVDPWSPFDVIQLEALGLKREEEAL